MQKKTKIVATIGPASEDKSTLADLERAGVDAIRLNFSHGDHDEHGAKIDRWEDMLASADKHKAVIADLAGPEVRTGELPASPFTVTAGDTVILTTDQDDADELPVTYAGLPRDVSAGDNILIDDGAIALSVTDTTEKTVETTVDRGGTLTDGERGVNVPAGLDLPALTTKDKQDLTYALERDVDYVALSFVKSAKDIKQLQNIINEHKTSPAVIAKIETQAAINNINAIIAATDAIMVARGDLAVEVGVEKVPSLQKRIINQCNAAGVAVITATQMLQSMTENTTPTRAEASDVANAVLDGTDAVMLSGETATGEHPVRSVDVMRDVVANTEHEKDGKPRADQSFAGHRDDHVVNAVTSAAVETAHDVNAAAIVALTDSGFTARMISRYRPIQDIIAFSRFSQTCRQLSISYGVHPELLQSVASTDEAVSAVKAKLRAKGYLKPGDTIVIAAGLPADERHNTNAILVETM